MSGHWIDENKGIARKAFEEAKLREEKAKREAEAIKPTQPQLTPNGPLRHAVDAQVREQMAAKRAEIEQRKEEIKQKFEQDRQQGKILSR